MKRKPYVDTSRCSGNAFSILAQCRKAAKKAGWTKNEIDNFTEKAQSGDYDNLLQVCMEYFDLD